MDYFDKADLAITICDKDGIILEMNEQSRRVNLKPEQELVGSNVLDCHPEPARSMLEKMMREQTKNAYTIEKGDVKKLIYQIPWYDENGAYAGFAELSMVIPFEMPHKIRKPKNN
ncbi:diguanylate cyclase [Porphyromonas crevioricanis]|uniref:PAS domain-containing protein n=1 Tax=Porphyromonas crevioricanis TaxID=393921 RepID=UPI00052CD515|nr:PAS domain-containing protein [Porphyromonas crevioricanis]KGN90352.1 diguanylate cyclase [Porphyromonas crevioricanis]